MEPSPKRLRSAMWSSDTLLAGMREVSAQTEIGGLLVKTEEDEAMLHEFGAAPSNSHVLASKATCKGFCWLPRHCRHS